MSISHSKDDHLVLNNQKCFLPLSIYFIACSYLCRVETLLSFLCSLLELVHVQLMLRHSCKQDFMVVTSDIIWRHILTKYCLVLGCGSWWVSIAEDTVLFRCKAQSPWSQMESPILSCLMMHHELFWTLFKGVRFYTQEERKLYRPKIKPPNIVLFHHIFLSVVVSLFLSAVKVTPLFLGRLLCGFSLKQIIKISNFPWIFVVSFSKTPVPWKTSIK